MFFIKGFLMLWFVAYTLHNNNERLHQLCNRHNQHNMIFLFQEHLWKTTSIPRGATCHVSRAGRLTLQQPHDGGVIPGTLAYLSIVNDFKLLDFYGFQLIPKNPKLNILIYYSDTYRYVNRKYDIW